MPALVVRHQPGRPAWDRQAACPRYLTLPVRTRTHGVALRLEAADRQPAVAVMAARDGPKATGPDASRPIVMLDGAHVRAVPGHQVRNFEAICGKVEHEGRSSRRFALVRSVAERPHVLLRAALRDQGWREGEAVTAISDGDPALPALVRSATGGPVEHILDWFHLSMRVRHVEQTFLGLHALEPVHFGPLDRAQVDVSDCDTCSGTATTNRRARLWAGSPAGRWTPPC